MSEGIPATPEQKVSALLRGSAERSQSAEGKNNVKRMDASRNDAEHMQADHDETERASDEREQAHGGPELEPGGAGSRAAEPAADDAETPISEKPERIAGETDQAGDVEGVHEESPKFNIEAIAEKLGIEPAEVYQIEIPLGQDREPITLGQFKDHVQDLLNVDDAREALENRQAEHEASVLRDQQETLAIINALGENLTPELRQMAAQQYQTHMTQQRALMLQMLPEWRDAERYAADRSDMFETLTSHYPVSETQLSAQQEAVTVLMMRDLARFWRREKSIDAERKRIPKVPRRPGKEPARTSKRGASKHQQIQQAAASSDPRDKVAAVKRLLAERE